MPFKANTIETFWNRVNKNGPTPEHVPHLGQCWIWKGCKRGDKNHKYGVFEMNHRRMSTHRWSYEFEHGSFNSKMDVLHKCDNPACVNPGHLVLGDDRDNMVDCVRKNRHKEASKTHCPQGHPYDGKNLAIYKQGKKSGGKWFRACRACHNARQKIRYRNNKERMSGFSFSQESRPSTSSEDK